MALHQPKSNQGEGERHSPSLENLNIKIVQIVILQKCDNNTIDFNHVILHTALINKIEYEIQRKLK